MIQQDNLTRSLGCAVAMTPTERRDFFPEPLNGELRAIAPDASEIVPDENFAAALAEAAPEVLLACWSTPLLPPTLPSSLRYVCYLAGTVRSHVTRRHLEDGLIVTNWGGSISRTVAEAALWHILTGLRRGVHWTLTLHRDRGWKNSHEENASLFGRRVGLHGFGHVARELVQLLQPFGCVITAVDPALDDATAAAHGVATTKSLDALFSQSDIVVEVAPLNDETRGLITGTLLSRLRPGSVFVNVGRADVVDQAAMISVAREGRVFFGLDVFAAEPLPADSPLRGLHNVSLTPHLAGPTSDRYTDAGAFALANLRAYAEGRPLRAVITPAVYDFST